MIGIYSITNKLNGKRYIGKSKNIERRFWFHKNALSKCGENPEKYKRAVNRYLAAAVIKVGIENFNFEVLETFDSLNGSILADAEIAWMEHYNTTNREFGYNLKKDSSTKVEVHEDTRRLISELNRGENNPNYGNRWTDEKKACMSEKKRNQYKDGTYDYMKTEEWRLKLSAWSVETWKDLEKKNNMARKVAEAKSELKFEQYDKMTGELVATYNSMLDIIDKYPDFHKKAIYSVCNGWKKSYRGFVWKSIKKE